MPDNPELATFAQVATRAYGMLETIHVVTYFAAEPRQEYERMGLRGRGGYFASRSAPLGAVPAEVTIATFSVFEPDFVRRTVPACWDLATPEQWQAARVRGVDAALHRVLGRPDVTEAVEIVRRACAVLQPHGRTLYAANSRLEWPQDPLMALWHATTLIREHRGDGHIAVLLQLGLHPVQAMVLHGLRTHQTPFLKSTRGWSEADWAAAEGGLAERGLIEDRDGELRLTDAGTAAKADIEARTFATSRTPWEAIGLDGCQRLIELTAPLRAQLLDSDVFPPGSPLKARQEQAAHPAAS